MLKTNSKKYLNNIQNYIIDSIDSEGYDIKTETPTEKLEFLFDCFEVEFNYKNNKLFYDVIYNPVETNFLKQAKRLGNKTENGKLMFVYQAAEAFKIWHGVEPQINDETLEVLNND